MRRRELELDSLEIVKVQYEQAENAYTVSVRRTDVFQPQDIPAHLWTPIQRTRQVKLKAGHLTCPCPTGVLLWLPCRHVLKVLSCAGLRLQHTDLHFRLHNLFLSGRLIVPRTPADCHYTGVRSPQLVNYLIRRTEQQATNSAPAEYVPTPADVGQDASSEAAAEEGDSAHPETAELYHLMQETIKAYQAALHAPAV